MDEDIEGLMNFRDCLLAPELALTTVDLLYNRIGNDADYSVIRYEPLLCSSMPYLLP